MLVLRYLSALLIFGLVAASTTAHAASFTIRDNATGGDCGAANFPGAWDAASTTCTLQDDLTGSIIIADSGITIDGNGKTLTPGPNDVFGVLSNQASDLRVSGLVVEGFNFGLVFQNGQNIVAENNEVSKIRPGANACGICFSGVTLSRIVRNLKLDANLGPGIRLWDSNTNEITGNIVSNNRMSNIHLKNSSGNSIHQNEILGDGTNPESGITVLGGNSNFIYANTIKGSRSRNIELLITDTNQVVFNTMTQSMEGVVVDRANQNDIYCNNIEAGADGVDISGNAAGNLVWWNNFLVQTKARDRNPAGFNLFDLLRPVGGNHWAIHAPACQDQAPADGFCDAPYVFPANADNLPHVKPILWQFNPLICLAARQPKEESLHIEAK